jgi:hypothetical protein
MVRKIALIAIALFAVLGMTGCYTSPENGKISVLRGDGPIEGHSGIKGVICPGEKKFVWNDETHDYPDSASQRTFKFNADEDADTAPIQGLRTKDGYKVTLNGTVYFTTACDCTDRGKRLVEEFDKANAARPDGQKPWEDFSGWLENQWKPILDSTGRNVMLSFKVEQVLSSAVLLNPSSQSQDALDEKIDQVDNKGNIQQIEAALAEGLVARLNEKLGDDYFTDITVVMQQPFLPDIDDAIATAQKAFAQIAEVRAERQRQQEQVQVEKEKRRVSRERARGYATCPSCARQDELEALPNGLQTLVFGDGSPVSIGRR